MASIQGIYIALFGRPADPAGLAYFNAETNNGANLSAIGDLAGTAEYQEQFQNLTNVQIVTKIYQDLFGRDPDAAGLAYFVAALNSGSQTINTIAINILDGAQGDDAKIVENKIAAANLFTAEIDTAEEIGSYQGKDAAVFGRDFINTVTLDTVPTQADAAAAVKAVVDFGVQGETKDIPVGADYTGTSNNDTYTVVGEAGYTGTGSINGGFGNDTVIVNIAGTAVTSATSLVSVEKLEVSGFGSLDLSKTVGLKGLSVTDGSEMSISGIAKTLPVTVSGEHALSIAYTETTGTSDAATINLDKSAGMLSVGGIETLTLNVANVSSTELTASAATSVVITGTGEYTLTLAGDIVAPDANVQAAASALAKDAVINASAHVGQFIFDNGGQDLFSVIGGAQNDKFTIGDGDFGVSITGGAGSDDIYFGTLSNVKIDVPAEGATADATVFTSSINAIADFNGAEDTLHLALTGDAASFNNVQLSNITNAASLSAALAVVAEVAVEDSYAVFQYQGSTYVYQNDDVAGFGAGDGLVQLVGFTGALNAANFVVSDAAATI